ncbi:diguanylate cyclase (GGDEF domain) [hydrothermal vent metagenome]|uniref:Diguanylate cyclase (GGDEF domain) n=1 Tax=hydrothermal vent metagenome TaxID=652676 RepID=A0A1W1CAY1_9ZZZZ
MNRYDITILYVEDETNVREMLTRFLQRFCRELYVAKDGQEGLELYKEHHPDIVISDIRMPRMNGLEMVKAIKTIEHTQLVLLLSAHSDSEFLYQAINLGVDGYILKPIDLEIVREKIGEFHTRIENKKAAQKLKESEEKFRTLTQISLTGIFIYQEQFIYVNPAFCDITGYTEEELLTMAPWEIVTPKYKEKIKEIAQKRIQGEFLKSTNMQLEVERKDGSVRAIKVSVATMAYKSRFMATGNMMDITEHIELEEKLKRLATKDALTGIYNRYKTTLIIEDQIKRENRYNEIFSLLMFDIDHFKKVNDTYGHDIGDYVLQELCHVVSNNIRDTDKFGRWGGEEFMLIAPHTNKKEAIELAEKIRKSIEEHPFKQVQQITISVGVTEYKREEEFATFTKRVDDALYQAKTNGRNQVVFL